MVSTIDGKNLITASNDGSIIVWNSYERDQKSVDHGRDLGNQWAEEVLVSRSDLEEKNREIIELKTRVEELKMENEYQLRLKDMSYNEKMKELTEKFVQEMEALKVKSQLYKTEKEKQASAFEEDITRLNENHDREIVDLEQSNNQKLMFEYERYQELQAQREHEETKKQIEEDADREIVEMRQKYEETKK